MVLALKSASVPGALGLTGVAFLGELKSERARSCGVEKSLKAAGPCKAGLV